MFITDRKATPCALKVILVFQRSVGSALDSQHLPLHHLATALRSTDLVNMCMLTRAILFLGRIQATQDTCLVQWALWKELDGLVTDQHKLAAEAVVHQKVVFFVHIRLSACVIRISLSVYRVSITSLSVSLRTPVRVVSSWPPSLGKFRHDMRG